MKNFIVLLLVATAVWYFWPLSPIDDAGMRWPKRLSPGRLKLPPVTIVIWLGQGGGALCLGARLNRETESTDAPDRGGLPRSSDEGSVMELERRGRVIAVERGPTGFAGRSPMVQRKAAAFVRWHEPDDARVSCPVLGGAQGEIPWAYSATAEVMSFPDPPQSAIIRASLMSHLENVGGKLVYMPHVKSIRQRSRAKQGLITKASSLLVLIALLWLL